MAQLPRRAPDGRLIGLKQGTGVLSHRLTARLATGGSQQVLPKAPEPFSEALGHRTLPPPGAKLDFLRAPLAVFKYLVQFLPGMFAEHDRVQFVVKHRAAIIEIRRADH